MALFFSSSTVKLFLKTRGLIKIRVGAFFVNFALFGSFIRSHAKTTRSSIHRHRIWSFDMRENPRSREFSFDDVRKLQIQNQRALKKPQAAAPAQVAEVKKRDEKLSRGQRQRAKRRALRESTTDSK